MDKSGEWDEISLLLEKTGMRQDAASANALRNERKSLYDNFNRKLNTLRFGKFAYFLNYGYVPDGKPTFAVVSPPESQFDAASRRLVLEVICDTSLEERDVLDVSCGRGAVAVVIQEYFKPGSYLGIDLSEEAVSFCRDRHAREGFEFREGDAQALSVDEACFDVAINIEASHNYPDIIAFYRELARTLRPGGRFLYADLMAPATFDRHINRLREMGFHLLREADITSNVLLSCRETAERRLRAYPDPVERAYMAHWLASPGSQTYRAMEQGLVSYRLYAFRTAQN